MCLLLNAKNQKVQAVSGAYTLLCSYNNFLEFKTSNNDFRNEKPDYWGKVEDVK